MADSKLTALAAVTSWASGDLLYLGSDPAGTPASKKITLDNVLAKVPNALSFGWVDALISRLAANSFGLGGRLSITAPANASALSSTGYSLTGSNASAMVDLAGTWNTSGNPIALKIAMTNTASGSSSKFLSLLAGASGTTEVLNVSKTGRITGDGANPYLELSQNDGTLLAYGGSNYFFAGNSTAVGTASNGLNITGALGTAIINTDAANSISFRNGTNAQTFNLYGTYTNSSNYRRVALAMSTGGVATLAPAGAGTGSAGNVLHISGLPTSNPGPGILWNNAGSPAIGT